METGLGHYFLQKWPFWAPKPAFDLEGKVFWDVFFIWIIESWVSNYRLDGRQIKVTWNVKTGLAKLGALIGDGASLGCNVVTNPGTIILPGTVVLPSTTVGGLMADEL